MAFYYNTLELEADSSFNSSIAMRGLTTAIRRELAAAVYNGNGVGKPLGMLQSPGLVSVAKEAGQTAATIVWENVSKMYNRTKGAKSEFVWLIHPDCNYQLEQMVKVVGMGGAPIYQMATLPDSVDTLRGRRVLESDQCQTLGTKGDIMLVNPKEYALIYKGGIQADSSIHVGFLTAENCFRVIFRCNGFPKNRSALTIKNSSNTRASISSLDTRS
jgi:HK97 family phage major capsid protein